MNSLRKRSLVILLALAVPAFAEDYQCQNSDGCNAAISVDGELQTIAFRKGDIVSTDDGWVVHPDDGWVKVRSNQGSMGWSL